MLSLVKWEFSGRSWDFHAAVPLQLPDTDCGPLLADGPSVFLLSAATDVEQAPCRPIQHPHP